MGISPTATPHITPALEPTATATRIETPVVSKNCWAYYPFSYRERMAIRDNGLRAIGGGLPEDASAYEAGPLFVGLSIEALGYPLSGEYMVTADDGAAIRCVVFPGAVLAWRDGLRPECMSWGLIRSDGSQEGVE
jgi:hypothetical protein